MHIVHIVYIVYTLSININVIAGVQLICKLMRILPRKFRYILSKPRASPSPVYTYTYMHKPFRYTSVYTVMV